MKEKHSKQFKQFFNDHFEAWSRENNLNLRDLADRCGVTSSYLGQVKNYGRVPGLPVLILMAFNFKLTNPAEILKIADFNIPWPYRLSMKLKETQDESPGFINFKIDMSGFQGAIREIVREEIQPRTSSELRVGNKIRVGINLLQSGLINNANYGIFKEVLKLVTLSMRADLEFIEVDYRQAQSLLSTNKLDLYGPIYITADRISQYTFSSPLGHSPMCNFWRTAPSKFLNELPEPKSLEDLKKHPYKIAVLAEACSHDYALNVLNLDPENIIICENSEEVTERLTLNGLKRSAHLAFCDMLTAQAIQESLPASVKLLFKSKPLKPEYDLALAVRPDWAEFLTRINHSIDFLKTHGMLENLYRQHQLEFLLTN